MRRRAFISMMVGGAGALVLPMWRKPHQIIFVPPREAMSTIYRMANQDFYAYGFGMERIKYEGGKILYDALPDPPLLYKALMRYQDNVRMSSIWTPETINRLRIG